MPARSSSSCAAWAPVRPFIARTREYLLKALLVRQLAHSESTSAGTIKTRYIGSKYIGNLRSVEPTATGRHLFRPGGQPAGDVNLMAL